MLAALIKLSLTILPLWGSSPPRGGMTKGSLIITSGPRTFMGREGSGRGGSGREVRKRKQEEEEWEGLAFPLMKRVKFIL